MPWDQVCQDQHQGAFQLVSIIILLSFTQLEKNEDKLLQSPACILAPHQFDLDIDVDVTFLRNGTPLASITFEVS